MMHDKIFIRDLVLPVIIGTNPDELLAPQNLTFNITLHCDLSRAGKSDHLQDTVDYFTFTERVHALVVASRFALLEALAEAIQSLAFTFSGVNAVTVHIEKPAVLKNARAAAIEIYRERPHD